MESPSRLSSEINQSCIQVPSSDSGCCTPPRSTTNPSFSQLFHQPKLLTSAELKRRFPPLHSSQKKRRHHPIRKNDCLVPAERNLNIPVILPQLFDSNQVFSSISINQDDCIVPLSSSMIRSKLIHPRPNFNCFKLEQENSFSISETIMTEKLKILLQNK